jgi:polyhydroxyalkanoate synthesis regulator protein
MNGKSIIFFLLVVLLLLAGIAYLVNSIQQTAQSSLERAVQPFEQSNAALQTQVSQLMNPTPTIIPDPVTYIQEVRALARLETIQYSVEKVITAELGQGNFNFLFGDSLLFVAHGVAIAGIDMSKIQPQDMVLVNGVLNVRLPPAEIFIVTLDNNKSYVYRRDTGILTKQTVDLETLARQRAEEEIQKAVLEDGILNQAQNNAELFLYKFFQSLGYRDVVFVK